MYRLSEQEGRELIHIFCRCGVCVVGDWFKKPHLIGLWGWVRLHTSDALANQCTQHKPATSATHTHSTTGNQNVCKIIGFVLVVYLFSPLSNLQFCICFEMYILYSLNSKQEITCKKSPRKERQDSGGVEVRPALIRSPMTLATLALLWPTIWGESRTQLL